MTDYTKATNFATKDSLPSGNPAKIVKGTEIDTEFNSIATAIATKANKASPTFTGTLTAADMAVSGDLTVTGDATISGNLTFGDAATDTINLAADIASNILPSADNTYDIGAIGAEWKDLYINGVAYVDAIDFAGTSITATGAELNTLDGITANVTELNYTDGVTSNIQTQLDNKQPLSAVLTATTASFTTADETKLDAIEAGATADQTASEILTAVKTVDGAGSGLDADLLDGNEATAFATAAQGTLADSALQSSDIGVSVQAYSAVLAATTASFTTADETKLDGIEAGAQVNDATTLLDADIGVNVLAYDSNLQSFVTTFTLPTTDSTAGYVLKTDGAGTLSFVAQSAYDESTVAITGGTIDGTTIGATTASTGSFSSLDVGGSDVVVDTDIGVTVQAYDATIVVDADIGVSVQAYDADTTKNDVANTFTANQTFDNGIIEEYNATGTSGAVTIDLDTGNNFSTAMAGAVTYTFSNPATSGKVSSFTLKVVNDGNAITWPASVDWPSATAPTLSASGETDYFVFITHDGGTTWYGFTAGQGMA